MPSDFISTPPYNVIQPGAYSAVNASLISQPSVGNNQPIPCVLGTAQGGQPLVPLYFKSPGLLQQVLRGGPGYDAARFCFDGGAQQVAFCRVGNSPTQGSLNLIGTGTCITLTSKDWGTWVNSVLISVATGPIITLSYTDALGNVFTEKWDLTGVGSLTNAKIASAINGQTYGYSASNYVTATAGAGTLPLSTVSNSPLAGGTDGLVPVAGDWTNGLTAIQAAPVDIVVPATNDATVHAQVLTHCQNMSAPNARRERVMYAGGALGESVSATTARMAALPSARAALVYPGMYDYSAAGTLTLYDPFYHAAKVAGMVCAQADAATSLVHKIVPIVQAETDLSTIAGGAVDVLLQAGVTPVTPAPAGGYWIVDQLTGYNVADQVFRDMTSTRSADYVAQYARRVLETKFVGTKRLLSTQNAIASEALTICKLLKQMQVIADYKTPTVDPGQNVNSWNVGLPVQLVSTNKFIFISVALQPSVTTGSSVTAQDTLS